MGRHGARSQQRAAQPGHRGGGRQKFQQRLGVRRVLGGECTSVDPLARLEPVDEPVDQLGEDDVRLCFLRRARRTIEDHRCSSRKVWTRRSARMCRTLAAPSLMPRAVAICAIERASMCRIARSLRSPSGKRAIAARTRWQSSSRIARPLGLVPPATGLLAPPSTSAVAKTIPMAAARDRRCACPCAGDADGAWPDAPGQIDRARAGAAGADSASRPRAAERHPPAPPG